MQQSSSLEQTSIFIAATAHPAGNEAEAFGTAGLFGCHAVANTAGDHAKVVSSDFRVLLLQIGGRGLIANDEVTRYLAGA